MTIKKSTRRMFSALIVVLLLLACIIPAQAASSPAPLSATINPNPPAQTVKLIFIHHSTGENLLRDDYGLLGKKLGQNNYFVSDTNYGWGPNAIGDRTDIPDWLEWFRSPSTPVTMNALFAESGQNSVYTRTLADPGGQNTIVMFKSCFPNSNLSGNPNDPPDPTPGYTVGHAKYVYNEILKYFRAHPDKLFIVITAPPVTDPTYAANARAFNNWLYNDWLTVNAYPFSNVAVFDFYNVLTHPNAHHRYNTATSSIEHIVVAGSNTSYYPSGDDHPNVVGSQKATTEFIPLLNIFYNRWKADDIPQTRVFYSDAAQDGWILESAENSNIGGAVNSGAVNFRLGDDAANRQYRAILHFNTSSLPDAAVITSAALKIRYQGLVGTSPFSTLGALRVDMRKPFFGTAVGLQSGDFQAAAGRTSAAVFSATPIGVWYRAALSPAGRSYINLTGYTQFRLRFTVDDNNNNVADFMTFFSGNHTVAAVRPTLIIQYYAP
ncbi:MAG: hypothetical protein PHQ36_14130 [Anaerolineales bacterium]|nr:hypothetical protein [Anaerolineales bacterium]